MAKHISNMTTLDTMCRERQAAEQRLAKQLYKAFSEGVALKKIQEVGARVVNEMLEAQDSILGSVIIKFGGDLDIFNRFKTLQEVLAGQANLTPGDIADIIFLCGEWVLAGGGTKNKWPAKEVQGAYKVGVTQTEPKKGQPGWMAQYADDANKAVWKAEVGGRHRGDWTGGVEKHIQADLGPASKPGISIKRSLEGSTVLKVDRLFGLLRGADISGSASEGASILERWGSDLLHSAYYLLPLASLVYNGHHTILEVALTMSLNKIMDYHIGFYSSLLPDNAPPELDNIVAALQDAEDRADHFVVFFKDSQPAGCLLFDQISEKKLLRTADFGRATQMLARAVVAELSDPGRRGQTDPQHHALPRRRTARGLEADRLTATRGVHKWTVRVHLRLEA